MQARDRVKSLAPHTQVVATQPELKKAAVVRIPVESVVPGTVVQVPASALRNQATPVIQQVHNGPVTTVAAAQQMGQIMPAAQVHPATIVAATPRDIQKGSAVVQAQARDVQKTAVVQAQVKDIKSNVPVVQQEGGQASTPKAAQQLNQASARQVQVQVPKDMLITATQSDVNPAAFVQTQKSQVQNQNAVLNVAVTEIKPSVPVVQQVANGPVSTLNASQAGVVSQLPAGTMVSSTVEEVHSGQMVNVQTPDIHPEALVQVPASAVQSNAAITPATQQVKVQRQQGQVKVQGQQQQVKAAQLVQVHPEIEVSATPVDLKDTHVLVDTTAVLPSERANVIQVSPGQGGQSLAHPSQLKQAPLMVQAKDIKPNVALVQTGETISTVKSQQKQQVHTQKGGAGSSFSGSFYAQTALGGPAEISRVTSDTINQAPMFHPLELSSTIPTLPSTGIVPVGIVLAQQVGGRHQQRRR
jgi:hypothetical protein